MEELRTTKWIGLVDVADYTGLSSLAEASNVCITDSGDIVTRIGYSAPTPLAGIHSLLVVDDTVYAVTPSTLYMVGSDGAIPIYSMGGGSTIAYAHTPMGTIITDRMVGVVVNGAEAVPWVGREGGLDTVQTTDPDVSEARLEGVPTTVDVPCLGYGNGILVSLVDGVALHSFPYSITTNNPEEYVALQNEVTALTRVGNITVLSSIDGTYTYNGEYVRKVSDYPMIRGSSVVTDGNIIGINTGHVVVFATHGGVCVITDSGEYKELTAEKVSWHTSAAASAAVVRIGGSWQYVIRMSNAEPYQRDAVDNQVIFRR